MQTLHHAKLLLSLAIIGVGTTSREVSNGGGAQFLILSGSDSARAIWITMMYPRRSHLGREKRALVHAVFFEGISIIAWTCNTGSGSIRTGLQGSKGPRILGNATSLA